MNKLLTKVVGIALGMSMAIGAGVAAGVSGREAVGVRASSGAVYTFSSTSDANADEKWGFATGGSGTAAAWNSNKSELRLYSNNTITFTAGSHTTLTNASFTCVVNASSGTKPTGYSVNTGTLSTYSNTQTSFTWTGSASSFTITISGSKGNIGLKTVTMTYTVETPAVTPEVSDLDLVYTNPLVLDGSGTNLVATGSILYEVTYAEGKPGDGEVTVSTSNEHLIATDDGAGEISLSSRVEGNYTVTISTVDKDSSNQIVTENVSVSVTNLKAVEAASLVTSSTTLKAGDTLFIGRKARGVLLSPTITSNVVQTVSGYWNGNNLIGYENAAALTLGGTSSAWTLSYSGDLLGTTEAKKMAWGDGTTTWTISADSNGAATISSTAVANGSIQYNYNNGNDRFTTYTSIQESIELYRIPAPVGPADKILKPTLRFEGTAPTTLVDGQDFALTSNDKFYAQYTDSEKYPDEEVNVVYSPSTITTETTSVVATYVNANDETATYTFTGFVVVAKTPTAIHWTKRTTSFNTDSGFVLSGDKFEVVYSNGKSDSTITTSDPNLTFTLGGDSIALNASLSLNDDGKILIAHYTLNGVTADSSQSVISVTKSNYIQTIYGMSSNAEVEFDGYYAGSLSDGPIVMNGHYGILLYHASVNENWVVDQTVLHVTGTVSVYKNLFEVANCTVSIQNDQSKIALIDKPENYTLSGDESADDKTVANRRTYVHGTLKSMTETASGGNYDIVVTQQSGDVDLYYKAADQDPDIVSELLDSVGKTVTIKAFTSFFTAFQARVYGIVETDDDYTVEQFSQSVLDLTDDVCEDYNGTTNNKEALVSVWNTLGGDNYWQKLNDTEKAKFLSNQKTPNYNNNSQDVVENALGRYNYLCKKYSLNNFTGRSDVNDANVTPLNVHSALSEMIESYNPTIVIAIISILTLTATGGYFFLRKRKEN